MKTIYSTVLFEPHKIEVSEEALTHIQEAREEVYRLGYQNTSFRPSIDIVLSQIAQKNQFRDDKTFRAKVKWDYGDEDSFFARHIRTMSEREPRGFVIADVGYYGDESWESVIDNRDFSELPNVWFSESYLDSFIMSWRRSEQIPPWEVLHEDDKRLILPHLALVVGRKVGRSKAGSPLYEELVGLRRDIRDVWQGERGFETLIPVFEGIERCDYRTYEEAVEDKQWNTYKSRWGKEF